MAKLIEDLDAGRPVSVSIQKALNSDDEVGYTVVIGDKRYVMENEGKLKSFLSRELSRTGQPANPGGN